MKVLICLFVICIATFLLVYKSKQTVKWKMVVGGLVSFFGIFYLIVGLTSGGGGFLSQLIFTLLFIGLGIFFLYPGNKKFYLITIVICVTSALISIPIKRSHDEEITRTSLRWDNIEHVTKNINGTVWQNIEPNYEDDVVYWYRLEFKGGSVYYYEASPSDGKWDAPKVFKYSVGEDRYSNTGEKYRYVQWIDSISHSVKIGYKFSPRDEKLHTWCTDVGKSEDINMTEGDIPAWRD